MNSVAGLNWNSDGYAALSGPSLTLFNRIDSIFQTWAKNIGADDHRFPSLIALADLKPIAYLQSFPHLATFACSPGTDHETLSRFSSVNQKASEVQCDANWEASQSQAWTSGGGGYPRASLRTNGRYGSHSRVGRAVQLDRV